jgi:hypothetical protein
MPQTPTPVNIGLICASSLRTETRKDGLHLHDAKQEDMGIPGWRVRGTFLVSRHIPQRAVRFSPQSLAVPILTP